MAGVTKKVAPFTEGGHLSKSFVVFSPTLRYSPPGQNLRPCRGPPPIRFLSSARQTWSVAGYHPPADGSSPPAAARRRLVLANSAWTTGFVCTRSLPTPLRISGILRRFGLMRKALEFADRFGRCSQKRQRADAPTSRINGSDLVLQGESGEGRRMVVVDWEAVDMLCSLEFWRMAVCWTLSLLYSHLYLLLAPRLSALFPSLLGPTPPRFPRRRFAPGPSSPIQRPLCVVTGASSGLGAAAARALAAEGYHVILGQALFAVPDYTGVLRFDRYGSVTVEFDCYKVCNG
ncbi:hypothetical protein B296_00026310 [Ensete ventricosum]|uniref:Uncharacterized protein n=1 Tax=Ensete ventricosum TaxID=4639 RepID=A0A427A3R6_ENSVE|nr:hypothetical protein B296_00026310 [Ensete ventricosum]